MSNKILVMSRVAYCDEFFIKCLILIKEEEVKYMKSKLYLRIILLINYIIEENLFVNAEKSPVKHAASWFSVRKKFTKKKVKRD